MATRHISHYTAAEAVTVLHSITSNDMSYEEYDSDDNNFHMLQGNEELSLESEQEDFDDEDTGNAVTIASQVVRPPRKLLTRKRLVCFIETADDASKYNPIELTDLSQDPIVGHLGPKSNPNTPKIQWTKVPPTTGRRRRADVRNQAFGLKQLIVDQVKDIRTAWNLMINEDILNIVSGENK